MPRKPLRKPRPSSRTKARSFWSSRRLQLGGAAFVLVGLLGWLLQFTARVRSAQAQTFRLPLEAPKREAFRSQVAALFPWYTFWHWWVRWGGPLRAGEYVVHPGERAFVVWNRFRKGLQKPLRFYLKPQRSPAHLASFLGRTLAHDSLAWALAFESHPWHEWGFDRYTWLLVFLPDVYEVYWTEPPARLFQRLYQAYQNFWNPERRQRAEAIGLTPIEVGILASIVEQESYRKSEWPLIASVYLNRLRLGMPLQADPTVIYAVGDFTVQRVTHRMLEKDSPYNTYKRKGLPPGPIGTPSKEAIEAVLSYTPSSYLYFCARPDNSGFHDFSESYPEHLAKARRYQQALTRWLTQKK